MSERWAEATFGLMGRTPDHVAGFFAGFAAKPSVFAAAGREFAENVMRFYEYARDNHLYVSYAIVPPQIDRSKPAHQQIGPDALCRRRQGARRRHRAQGRAATRDRRRAVGLSAPELHPSPAAGRRGLCHRAWHADQRARPQDLHAALLCDQRDERFDYPLSSRFDETDALVVLDDVFVPWENVFVYRNLELCRDQWWRTPAHVYGNHQAQIRYATKLRFLIGPGQAARRDHRLDALPPVQIMLGEMAAFASIVENMVTAQEAQADDRRGRRGVAVEGGALCRHGAAIGDQSRIVDIVRELAAARMIMLPSSVAISTIRRSRPISSATCISPGFAARERVALLKMAWDIIGSEFAGRHQQYEKFYGGASFLVKQNMYRSYDFARAEELVDAALALPEPD